MGVTVRGAMWIYKSTNLGPHLVEDECAASKGALHGQCQAWIAKPQLSERAHINI